MAYNVLMCVKKLLTHSPYSGGTRVRN